MRLNQTPSWQAFRIDLDRAQSDPWFIAKRVWWLVDPPMLAVVTFRFGNALKESLPPRLADLVFGAYFLLMTPLIRALTGVEISYNATIGPGLRIHHGVGTVIGANATLGRNCTVRHGCNIGANVRDARMPTIGDDVSLGAQSQVLGPVSVGDRVRVGPGSVVLRDVPSDASVFGVPARVVAER